jgi:hypothetical protein
MKVFIEENELEIFVGASVADVLRMYSEEEYKNVNLDKKIVYDEFENRVYLDGEVQAKAKYFIRNR